MQEGERQARGQSQQQATHSGSRSRERQVVKADEAAEAARKAARKRAKARTKAVAKANRKLSAELAGPPVLRTMTAEGSASGMTRRRRCSGEEMATLSKFLSLICPSGTVCKHPLLPIAIGAIPATPHLTW